jgi:hypothetical protein
MGRARSAEEADMTQGYETAWLWAAKLAGAIAGSAISVAYVLPRGRREAALRFTVGVVSGLIFGGAAGLKIASELDVGTGLGVFEIMLMGSAASSLSAWWALGLVMRMFERGGARGER